MVEFWSSDGGFLLRVCSNCKLSSCKVGCLSLHNICNSLLFDLAKTRSKRLLLHRDFHTEVGRLVLCKAVEGQEAIADSLTDPLKYFWASRWDLRPDLEISQFIAAVKLEIRALVD